MPTPHPRKPSESRPSTFRLEDSQARLSGIIDSAMDAIISINERQEIILFNHAAESMFGYSVDRILGRPLNDLLPEKYRPNHTHHIQRFAKNGITNRAMGKLGRLYGLRADGTEFPIEASISHVNTADGEILTVILRDISERVKAENELLDRERHLKQSAEENARLYAQAEVHLTFLSSLRAIDLAITSSQDLSMVLNVVLDQVITQLGGDAADFLLVRPGQDCLAFAQGRGLLSGLRSPQASEAYFDCAETVAFERKILLIPNTDEAVLAPAQRKFFQAEKIESCFAAPLVAKGQLQGVMEVFRRSPYSPEPDWVKKLEALAGQAAIAIESARLVEDLQETNEQLLQAYDATIEGWSRALDLRDHETEGHTRRVTEMTMRLVEATGSFSQDDLRHIRWGCMLHDIGKMGVPDEILLKTGKLSEDERTKMREHPELAYELLKPIAYLRKTLDIPRYHHEQWDGKGYPYGLKGDHIPLTARYFRVVDVWDALRWERRYHSGWEEDQIIDYLTANAGTIFDPQAVSVFLNVFFPDRTDKTNLLDQFPIPPNT